MFDCVIDPDECSCSCHRTGDIHVIACCHVCPYCQKRINLFSYESHVKKHKAYNQGMASFWKDARKK